MLMVSSRIAVDMDCEFFLKAARFECALYVSGASGFVTTSKASIAAFVLFSIGAITESVMEALSMDTFVEALTNRFVADCIMTGHNSYY